MARAWRMACVALPWPVAALVAVAVPAWGASPAHADPLHTPECLHAQAELDAALGAPDARGSARLQQARRNALALCLGHDTGRRERSGAPYPAQAVPPIAARSARIALPSPPLPTAPPAVAERPATITMCDPTGCWDSAGRRLNRSGPGAPLWGPHGACLRQGGLLTCP